jgi:Rho termination factor, N-terminal domain
MASRRAGRRHAVATRPEDGMDWHDLQKMKVTDLREMAKEKLSLEGASGLHKDELVARLAEALGIPRPHKVVDAAGKTSIKQSIRTLKQERDEAIAAHDHERLQAVRRRIHAERRKLHRMAHLTH